MFRSKKDVDRHVQDLLRKVKSENERNQRCYHIAQQYFKVRDYESAKHYLALFMSVKEDSPLAHKLQGQIWEGLGDKVRALNSYKTSLEYEANQPELVLKMCELLCETDVAMDTDRAQYWCERGSDLFPHDPLVFRLKEKLLKLGGKANTQDFEQLINSELRARPNDVSVRTRLMRLYLETGRTKAAFSHAVEVEVSQMFRRELTWYECFAQVCQAYADEFPTQVNWQFYCSWISVMDRMSSLSLSDLSHPKKLVDCIQAIYSMDQVLFKAASVAAPKEYAEVYNQIIKHMSAQLCLQIATLILKRAKKEQSNWNEAKRAVSPVLFLALNPPLDTEAPWCLALKPNLKLNISQWANDGYYRVSQAGYTLLTLSKNAGKPFIEKVTHMATSNWRERTFQRIFTVLEQRAGVNTSHFVQTELLAHVPFRLPAHDSGYLKTRQLVPVYESVRETLHHLVWLGLETLKHNDQKLPSDFHTYSFTRLKFTAHNVSNMSAETLSVLDVDAFLYATVLCAAAIQEDEVLNGLYSSDRPLTLPADISNLLCTQEQLSWWSSALQVNSQQFSSSTNLVTLRQELQRGLEVVRMDGNHGLDVQLIVKLARTFVDRAASVPAKSGDQTALEERASLYWNAALPLLERMERNQAVRVSNSRLFEYPRKELSPAEVSSLLEEGRFFAACQLMKSDQHERAIEAFKPLRNPNASFYQAMIYKKLAAAELADRPREEITSEMRSKHVILLSKARECLNLTWERIRIDRRHPLHQSLPEQIAEVESALSRIEPDPDMMNRSEISLSEPSVSSVGSPAAGDIGLHSHSVVTPKLNGQTPGTPRRHRQSQSHSEHRRQNNGELVDVGQLLQIQTLHDDMKKMNDKIEIIMDVLSEVKRDLSKLKPPVTEDLYLFGDEEYPEDVLSGQYPPTFVPSYTQAPQPAPTFYPPPSRGVQGTSTVTYGAPPTAPQPAVLPLIPIRVPIDPALAAYQSPQNLAFYNQGALPFTDPQPLPDFLRQNIAKTVVPPVPQMPPPPVNVVITTSDTLPTGPPPVQPTLSVTIPPQHRLGTVPISTSTPPVTTSTVLTPPPHRFQIAMPSTANILNPEKSPIAIQEDFDSEDDTEVGEHDPCPDFRPIIPLPKEVNVTTGEEDDDILFENRAKLFRFIEKEWKERGIGLVKILKNKSTNKVRLLMRRDQVHKVCANHLLKSDMELTMLKNSDRALVWVANDFAEEVVQLEKFCIKFKTPEEALRFRDVFNDAKVKYGQSPVKAKNDDKKSSESKPLEKNKAGEGDKQKESSGKVNLGGFTFTSPPKLKETSVEKPKIQDENKKEPQVAQSPFAKFSFVSQKASENTPPSKSDISLKPSISNPPLFAGLDSTQNKHTLFNDTKKEDATYPLQTSTKDPALKVPNDNTPPKIILKTPTLQPTTSANKENTPKTTVSELTANQSKSPFSFSSQSTISNASKESPKSILKETPANNSNTPTSNVKSSPVTKHVLFQDAPIVSPSRETPTLAALLSTPKTQVVDFAALSKMNENKTPAFGSEKKPSGFEGAGTPLFSTGSNRVRTDSEGEPAEEFVPSAEFKPVVPLPELIQVKTGEEGQEVLFNERAKLMRFDPETKEWKERGLGQMKILKDPSSGVTRFLMRRDQVLKVCCNHRIIQSLELKASPSSEKAWTWYAVDYSEGETKNELFAIRFKTVELAKAFKETVDMAQKQLREEGTAKRSCPDSASQDEMTSVSNATKTDAASLPKLSELFRPKAGSWECKACYTVNGGKDSTCVSCDTPKEKPKSPGPTVTVTSAPAAAPSLAEMFKPKAGSWECGGCLVRNDANKTICPACSTPKPGHEAEAKDTSTPSSFGSSSFSFGVKNDDKPSGFSFGIKPSETPKSSFTFGVNQPTTNVAPISLTAKETETPDTNEIDLNIPSTVTSFNFGQTPVTKQKTSFTFAPKTEIVTSTADSTTSSSIFDSKPQPSTFKFGNVFGETTTPTKASFTFGATTPTKPLSDAKEFAFGQSGKFEFNFSGVKAPGSPGSQSGCKSPRSPGGQETDSETEDIEAEADHIVFQPVVAMPEKVPLTTGEEDEEVLYSHRAKLYRFAQGEWKERGVGDIKILRHNDTHKIRLLMRREPILKICLNHYLTTDLAFTPKDDKSWLWYAQDFAEGQLTNEQFCLRLKTPEIAAEFKAAIESAKGELEATKDDKLMPSTSNAVESLAESNDVEIIYEKKISEELRQAALKLQLPVNFYSYLDAAPCPGCAGCEPDSEEDEQKNKAVPLNVESTKSAASVKKATTVTPLPSTTTTTVSQPFTFTVKTTSAPQNQSTPVSTSTASTTIFQPFTFSVKTTTTTSTTASSVFGTATTSSTPLLPTPSTAQSTFSFSLNLTSTSTAPTSTTPSTQNTSFFGGSPIFQSPAKSFFGNLGSSVSGVDTPPTTKPLLFGTNIATQSATTLSFGNTQNSTPNNIFSGTPTSSAPKATPLFNSASFTQPQSSVFGGSTPSIFGTSTTQDSTSKNAFSFNPQTPPQSFASLFGTPSNQTPTSGDTTSTQPTSIFGGTSTNKSPFFGGTPTTTIFGGTSNLPKNPFGGTPTTQPSLFGGVAETKASSTDNLPTSESENNSTSGPAFLFKPTGMTFGDVATSGKEPAFLSGKESSTQFSFAGAGSTVFGSSRQSLSKQNKDESGGESGDEDEEADTNHDPEFKPIIPLPDEIQVRTGEEDEDIEFCSRSKFFRYDANLKEWKERGTGDMKILKHRETNTYRLLLRREQVHKVVCNQLITPELELQPLASSNTAHCWAGMNMAEEYSEPKLEKVAVRFKYPKIAQDFKAKVEECIAIVKARKEKLNLSGVSDISNEALPSDELLEPAVTIEEVREDYSGEEGEAYGEEYEDYEDGDGGPLFEKRALLYTQQGDVWVKVGQGELRLMFDHSNNSATIMFKKDLSNDVMVFILLPDSNVQQLNDKEVSWQSLDEDSDMHVLKAEFSSALAATEFAGVFTEILELSQVLDSSYAVSESYACSGSED